MEVHHHGLHHSNKTWKSYFWEFIMLFFAVFCGFLAEWRLEVMIENHREQEYIHSSIEDIDADIKQTDKLLNEIDIRINGVDSLLHELASTSVQENSNKAYTLWLQTIGFPDFVQNDRTIQQLKSSGSLRIIRKKIVSDKIMEYDQAVRMLSVTQNNMNMITSNNTLFNQMFDIIKIREQKLLNTPLTDKGKISLNEAYANRYFWKINLIGLRYRLIYLHQRGVEVSEIIKKKYSIGK